MKSHIKQSESQPVFQVAVNYTQDGEEKERTVSLETDFELIAQHSLGKTQQSCGICGGSGLFETYLVPEMFQGTKEPFRYFACEACGCLQIEQIPEDLPRYYGADYYSFKKPEIILPGPEVPRDDRAILDVGCGSGKTLCELAAQGYTRLLGCDPFIEQDLHYENGVTIHKCDISGVTGQFDLILLADSFEHVEDPLETLRHVKRLLKPDGLCQISTPVFPNLAFEAYGPFWYQIDAPRHFYIQSIASMQLLAEQSGFSVARMEHGLNESAFAISRLYQQGVAFFAQPVWSLEPYFSPTQLADFQFVAQAAAEQERSDHVQFYLRHADMGAPVAEGGAAADADAAGYSPLSRIIQLNDTMEMALQHLAKCAEAGTLPENAYLLQDLLAANQSIRQAFDLLWLQGQHPEQV